MKSIFLFFLVIILCNNFSYAQDTDDTEAEMITPNHKITYREWKEEAITDIRLLPKFGSILKNEEQKEADEKLTEYLVKKHGSRRKGSDELVKLGFFYLRKGNPKTAMYRFNQAWTLDPKNENAFWGFATIYFNFDDLENSLKQLNEGLALNPKNANILTDKASIHLILSEADESGKELASATDLFTRSYAVNPRNQNTLFKLSAIYLMEGDCKKALKYYKEGKALGSKLITKEFTNAIEQGCPIK